MNADTATTLTTIVRNNKVSSVLYHITQVAFKDYQIDSDQKTTLERIVNKLRASNA